MRKDDVRDYNKALKDGVPPSGDTQGDWKFLESDDDGPLIQSSRLCLSSRHCWKSGCAHAGFRSHTVLESK
jgi:hypothetical protein